MLSLELYFEILKYFIMGKYLTEHFILKLVTLLITLQKPYKIHFIKIKWTKDKEWRIQTTKKYM